jgi:hypothetical protein
MITGRSASASSSAARATASAAGAGSAQSPGAGTAGPPSAASMACRSMGRSSTTARCSDRARASARVASATADAGAWMRSTTAPTDAAIAAWSTRKFDRSAAAGVSAASRSSGVRAFAASASAVTAFVNPGPWWTETTPTRPVTRAWPSAMDVAPPSWRASTTAAPASRRALVRVRFPLPISPKTRSTPSSPSARPTARATFTPAVRDAPCAKRPAFLTPRQPSP